MRGRLPFHERYPDCPTLAEARAMQPPPEEQAATKSTSTHDFGPSLTQYEEHQYSLIVYSQPCVKQTGVKVQQAHLGQSRDQNRSADANLGLGLLLFRPDITAADFGPDLGVDAASNKGSEGHARLLFSCWPLADC